ncbi:MAG: putative prokaryotic signal transducing protein [Candidatus Parcubacteria bacterium]
MKITSTSSEMDASVIKGLLESAGIGASIAPGNNSIPGSHPVLRGPNVGYSVFVEEDQVDKAKEIISGIPSTPHVNHKNVSPLVSTIYTWFPLIVIGIFIGGIYLYVTFFSK